MRFGLIAVGVVLGLAACEPTPSMPEDVSKYSYKSSDGEMVITYGCVNGATAAETKTRSAKAHQYFDQRHQASVRATVAKVTSTPGLSAAQLDAFIEKQVEGNMKSTFDRFQCAPIDLRDV